MRAFVRLLSVVSIPFGLGIARPLEGQWPIKEFEVLNVEPLRDVGSEPRTALDRVAADLDAWIVRLARAAPVDFEALGARTVPLDREAKARIEGHLSRAADLLESWGFPPPRLQPVVQTGDGRTAYRVFLVSGLGTRGGDYHDPVCATNLLGQALELERGAETIIRLNADVLDADGSIGPADLATVGHELFHAVEYATPFYEGVACEGRVGGWITEGAADAIGYDVVRTLGIANSFDTQPGWGGRSYSRPLPRPSDFDGEAMKNQRYNTSSFWRYLAEFEATGRAPDPAPGPVDYRSLSSFLSGKPAARDCAAVGDPCDAEVEYLDRWLRGHFAGAGLREIYPRFVGAFAHYGGYRASTIAESPEDRDLVWRGWGFRSGCPFVELENDVDGLRREDVLSLDDLASTCWEVWPRGFGHPVAVQIEVAGERREEVLRQMSAVVAPGAHASSPSAGGDILGDLDVDTAIVQPDPEGGFVARWIVELEDGVTTPFLVTNVAHTPWLTRPLRDLPITFTVLEPGALVSFGPSVSGRDPLEGVPLRDGEYRVPDDRLRFGVQGVRTDVEACLASLSLPSEAGDLVTVGGSFPVPLAEGDYLIEPPDFGDGSRPAPATSFQAPGILMGSVFLSCERGGCGEHGAPIRTNLYRGTFRISKISRTQVTGSFDMVAVDEPVRVSATFVAPLGGPNGLAPSHPCAPVER